MLTEDFLCSSAPMEELHMYMALYRQNKYSIENPKGRALLPVFMGVDWSECESLSTLYHKKGWRCPNMAKLSDWEKDLKELRGSNGVRADQVGAKCIR